MQYPDDAVLVARGKYSTLGKERRKQIQRVQDICTSIVTEAHQTLKDCEQMPPVNSKPIANLETCMANLQVARETLVLLTNEMLELKEQAWPE